MKATKKSKRMSEMDNLGLNVHVGGSDIEKPGYGTAGDLTTGQYDGDPIEYYDNKQADTLSAMNYAANACAANANADGNHVIVSEIVNKFGGTTVPLNFSISMGDESYTVYRIGQEIYYRDTDEFGQIASDIENGVPGVSFDSFKYSYENIDELLDSVDYKNRDDCLFVVSSIMSSLTGKSYENTMDRTALVNETGINENIKVIRRNKLGTDGIFAKSVKVKEAKYGTSDENNFQQEIEDKQKKDGTVGALDQQQQESAAPRINLPNVHRAMLESYLNEVRNTPANEIMYEPYDRVVVNIDGYDMSGTVTSVRDIIDGGQFVYVMVQGETFEFVAKDIKPDLTYLLNTRWGNTDYNDKYYSRFDLNPETRINNPVENDKYDYTRDYKDLNDRTVECDIVANGMKLNFQKYYASLKDINECKENVHVVNEDGEYAVLPMSQIVVPVEQWPWAVMVDNDDFETDIDSDEPLRKIRINPTSYTQAVEPDDLVEVIRGGKRTQMLKKNIKMIS